MKNLYKVKKAYDEIFEMLNKYKADIVFDVDDLAEKAKYHLFGVELVEKYGFNLDPKQIINPYWQTLKENIVISFWDGKRRKISWSDDGRQPNKEFLLCISYPSGAYILGDDYPDKLFQKLFSELKTYNPKYIDTTNKCLYFSLDNAGKIYNDYDSIIKKYHEENKDDLKRRKIERLKAELVKLEDEGKNIKKNYKK